MTVRPVLRPATLRQFLREFIHGHSLQVASAAPVTADDLQARNRMLTDHDAMDEHLESSVETAANIDLAEYPGLAL